MALYTDVVGQERAVRQLRRAATSPVHAYLLIGPSGSGKRAAALSFAANLLCPNGGCGECPTCQRVAHGSHLDVVVVERSGPFITVDQAKEIVREAARTPAEGARKVLVLVDFHLLDRAAPVLLKTIEEPAPGVVFVILADHVGLDLVTIASRCVVIEFDFVPEQLVAETLVASGVAPDVAVLAARASGGRLDRARLVADDPAAARRTAAWADVPERLDGTGAAASLAAAELAELVNAAGAELLARRQADELAEWDARAALTGERATARKQIEERHHREQRRLRTDEIRAGLAVLEGAYRDRAAHAEDPRQARASIEAARAVQEAERSLERNPNESLLLQALMVRLSPR